MFTILNQKDFRQPAESFPYRGEPARSGAVAELGGKSGKILTPEELEHLKADIDRLLKSDAEFEDAIVVAQRHGITFSSFKNRYGDLYEKVAAHRLRVRSILHAKRFAQQEAAAVEVIRHLHASRVRMIRPNVEAAMRSRGMTLKDPRLRAIAFAERARLEAEGYGPRK